MDWQMIYSFASKQAILGLCFDGIERLSEEYPEELKKNPIEMDLLMTWMGAAQQIHRQNMKVNMVMFEEKMIAPMDEKRGKLLLAEILNGGNFGQHFTKYGHFAQQGMAKKYFLKIWRNMHFVRYFPAEALCEPIFRTWHFFWRLKHGDNLSESSFLEALFGLEFSHADFANDADFFLCCLLVPQISRIYTDFF